jgi:hypothetical protein
MRRRDSTEKGGLAASNGFAGRSFEDELLFEEFVDDDADRPATNAHRTCEVSARNRLAGADEIQRDLAVDVARRALRGDTESARVDSAHSSESETN